ncbi:MAG: tetratricopeptide repeat protein, partial [Armatimonadetes bacterium]|nr:tetratricopeptide repeat protein [Armatimonadota bacterium]NIM24482.1 tetratricopeptide repeat protein [Armatimonadota bacterium]NIM68353.1 tetratricopeptide repeat protein [Armatimonadota bacterium]NIM76757.1 tetratricopeptide repeat protein [Armatimonadota bacterium]NIN06556.1 tetratricopeptide repeat protein [Armatimonadota bacterium]
LDEWTNLSPLRLGTDPAHVKHHPYWAGPLDCSAIAWLAWNEEFLYFAVDVTDSVFHQGHYDFSYIWENDSVQVALDPLLDHSIGAYANDDREFGWALAMSKSVTFCWQGPGAPCEVPEMNAAVVKKSNGSGWTLEAAIPWERIGIHPETGRRLGFTWMVNDSDKHERDGWIERTPGIGESKDPSAFGVLILSDTREDTAREEWDEKQYQAAVSHWQDLAATHQDTPQAGFAELWIGNINAAYADYEKASQAYSEVISSGAVNQSTVVGAVTALSELHAATGRMSDGIALCKSLIKAYPDDPDAISAGVKQLSELLIRDQGIAGARSSLLQLTHTLDAENSLIPLIELIMELALTHRMEGKPTLAIVEMQAFLSVLPPGSPAVARVADGLQAACTEAVEKGEADQVLEGIRALVEMPSSERYISPDALSLLAWAYEEKGEYEKAAEQLERLVTRFPDHHTAASASMALAELRLSQGEVAAGERMLQRIVQYYPRQEAAGQAGVRLGKLYEQRGEIQRALQQYRDTAANRNLDASNRTWAYIALGNLLRFELRDYHAARDAYDKALLLSADGAAGSLARVQRETVNKEIEALSSAQ